MIIHRTVFFSLGLLILVSSGATERGGVGERIDDESQICSRDPADCDGVGVSHLPLSQTLNFLLDGWWDLKLDSQGDDLKPQVSSKKVDLEGHVSLTRVSACRVKVVLQNYSVSDSEVGLERAAAWFVVSGGNVRAVCGKDDPIRSTSQISTHVLALTRSLMSAVLNVKPFVVSQNAVMTENDHLGLCETHYQTNSTDSGVHKLIRSKDLSRCVDFNNKKKNHRAWSHLTHKANWECQHIYQGYGEIDVHHRRAVMETEKPMLSNVVCHQTIALQETANFSANLNMSLIDTQEWEPEGDTGVILHEVDLSMDSLLPAPEVDPLTNVYQTLDDLCSNTRQAITPKAILVYSQLVQDLKVLKKDAIVRLYRQIFSGHICPHNKRLEKLFVSSLRDVTSSHATGAKCQLMASGTAEFSRLWISSLANVQEPTAETLEICSQLLEGAHWQESVLGVAAMAGQAVQNSCWGERSNQCNFERPACPQGTTGSCELGQSVQIIINNLAAHLPKCLSKRSEPYHQLLLAIRGLGNIGTYGYDVQGSLMSCGGTEIDYAIRLASVAAVRHGSCNLQVTNWLKWHALNETEKAELRITAFQSLHSCYPEEAETVALLITEKESDTQVKSYVSAYINNGGEAGDARLFSRHLTANLTSIFSLPETVLETDVIFQNSFLPQSVAFNLSSELLRHHGGHVQFGGRLGNVEEVLQSVFGHDGSAGNSLVEWITTLLHKAQEIFTTASEDFVKEHERDKRSYDVADVKNLLRKVKKEVMTDLRGWVFAGIGGYDHYFSTLNIDPFAIDWEEYLDDWLEQFLESSYSFLINSDVEVTGGWTSMDETAFSWSILGFPVAVYKQEGILHNAAASSHVNLLNLIKDPSASTLNIGLSASAGTYSVSHLSLTSLSGNVIAEYSGIRTKAFDVTAILKIQGSDSAELKIDIPRDSFQGDASQFVRHLHVSASDLDDDETLDALIEEDSDNFIDAETRCASADIIVDFLAGGDVEDPGRSGGPISKRHCKSHFEGVVGLSARKDTHLIRGQHKVILLTRNYLKKSEDSITGYTIGFSSKNPGASSLFLDMYVEAEGASREQKAGLVFGLTYSPHFTIKVILHSQQLSASGEVSLVNDPNLKRLEGHISFGRSEYGFKGELLMVEDGGQVSVKPRLVISYPGVQEDALLEGYMARYVSDKVRSLTVDLYTDGTLKQYLDVALKGTAEYRTPKGKGKVLALKNVHLATPHFSLGLESMISIKGDSVEAKVQATWDGEVVVIDGTVSDLGSGQDDQHYAVNLQLLLPEQPHIDTKINCVTQVHASEITNNVTLVIGEGDTQREFQAFHSTSWRITDPIPPHLPTDGGSIGMEDSIISHSYSGLAARIVNKLQVTSLAADLSWDIDHVLQVTNKSIENLIDAQIGDENHKIMCNVLDQSEEFFKYHMEIEISLPAWHFSYVDTLQQRPNGDMVGQSTTVMPSGRVYSSSSRIFKGTSNERTIFEMDYDVLVRDGGNIWKIVIQESFDWSTEHLRLQSSAEVGEITVFGLELALDGIISGDIVFHLKHWVKDLYEGEITLNNEGRNTDFNLDMIIIPFNREIKSKVALGHDGCTMGLLDGEISWDVRGDTSRTVTLSSVIQLPKDGQPLELKGSMSVLTWTWKTELSVVLGDEVGDNHRITYTLILPDESRFRIGSQLDFSVGESDVALSTTFDLQMPNGDQHNMSLVVQGLLSGKDLTDGIVTFDVQSPITEEVHFHIHVKTENGDALKKIDVMLKTQSEANYWEPFEGQVNGVWDGTTADMVMEGSWGIHTISIDSRASYWLVNEEHRIAGSAEIKFPLGKSWKQLKALIDGTFSVGHNPGRLKVTHSVNIEKDFGEIFNTEGDVAVHVPKVEGQLIISHAGSVARYHTYTLEGTFTGKELEIDIDGLVDDVPTKVSLHYIDGQEVTVKAFYRDENYFSTSVKTELRDVSIGIRKTKGTSYTLTTEGLLVYRRHRSQLRHELFISPSRGSSTLRLSPIQGHDFKLTTSRTKYNNHHWGTVISLDWGERTFNYQDDIYFPSYSECIIKIEIDAPDLNINKVTAEVEAEADSYGEQAVQVKYLVQNNTVHSARLMYYIHGTEDEMVWRAGARDVVLSAKEYSDLLVSHAITLPVGGMEIKSNMTVGVIPIVGIGVTVTPHSRVLVLSVCTTNEKCVRLRAHAHAQSTPSTRTYSVAAHALNSLFWKTQEDSLVQNSLTFSAQETLEKVIVTGGIRRVECDQVTCENFVVQGVLHATLQITEDDLEILLDTTNRTMKLKSIVRQSQEGEIAPASLPGGRLISASTLETQFWMDLNEDPEGMINWNSTVIRYASSRSSEWVVRSGLYHQSFGKVLRLGSQLTVEPTSARLLTLFDVFSDVQDALKFNIELLQDRGNHIMIANLTKAVEAQPRLIDVVVSFLPSPDSGEVSVVLIVPTTRDFDSHLPIRSYHPDTIYTDTHFTLTCGVDSPLEHTTISCRLTSPSVDENVYVRYQLVKDTGCKGLSTSLGLLHHDYNAQQKSCLNPNSFQASITTKTEKVKEKELAVRLGVLDTHNAELDVIDAVHVKFQLHPPFLLRAMAHSRGNMSSRWEEFKNNVQIELSELLGNAKSVAQALGSDIKALRSLARVSAPSPAHYLANYTQLQGQQLLEELEGDELMKEISQNAQMCIDVTSVLLDAGLAYLNHNYGAIIAGMGTKALAWTVTTIRNLGVWFLNAVFSVQDAVTSSGSYISSLPRRTLDYAFTLHLISDGVQWIVHQVNQVQQSYMYGVVTEALIRMGQYINWGLSAVYPSSEDIFNGEFFPKAWNIWVPLPECSHSLLDVWNILSGTARTSKHRMSLPTAILKWWHLLARPSALLDDFFPPFPAHAAVIGETNFVSLDGQTYSLNSSCGHILLTDSRDKLFTLVSEYHETPDQRSYTLFLGETVIKIQPDFQVTIDGNSVTLPHTSDVVIITRDMQHLTIATYDDLKQDLISLTCWTSHHACVVSVSGWLHADTRGLLGHLNLDPADDLMRPSGQIALSGEVFSHSWQVGSSCSPDRTTMEIPSSARARHLCRKLFLDFSSPTFPCQDSVDIMPYYETCIRYLASFEENKSNGSRDIHARSVPQRSIDNSTDIVDDTDWNNSNLTDNSTTENPLDGYSSISLQISVRDLIFPFTYVKNDLVDATSEELEAICNIMSAYFTICKAKNMGISLPPICGTASKLTYNEPVSEDVKQVDVVMLVDESSCDSFIYEHLVQPLPAILERIAHGKNISDVKMAAIGYGSGGGGGITYHIPGSSLLGSASQLRLSQPHNGERSHGSLRQALRAVSNFPFRPGSVRVALALRCTNQDIPKFTDTLPKEMVRRRLALFTLTPDLLVFNPRRPKAVRNTIGVDRWRVYSLRDDKQKSVDSWGVRRPNSHVAQLAMKSGGGVFTITPLRDEPRAAYYMKLFRKVLSRAIMKTVNNIYNKSARSSGSH